MMKSKKDRKRYREHMGQIKRIVRYKFKTSVYQLYEMLTKCCIKKVNSCQTE